MFLPPFKGTMLNLGLEKHHCVIGLSFRRNRTSYHTRNPPEAPVTSLLPAPRACSCLIPHLIASQPAERIVNLSLLTSETLCVTV